MTRQQRRRKEREKNTTYNLTASQLASIQTECERKAYREVKDCLNQTLKAEGERLTLQAFEQTFYLPLLVLRNNGWGKVRLKRFAEEMIDQWAYFEDGEINHHDIKSVIKEETGLDVDFKLNFKDKKARIEVKTSEGKTNV